MTYYKIFDTGFRHMQKDLICSRALIWLTSNPPHKSDMCMRITSGKVTSCGDWDSNETMAIPNNSAHTWKTKIREAGPPDFPFQSKLAGHFVAALRGTQPAFWTEFL